MTQPLIAKCPHCGQKNRIPDSGGKPVRCGKCKTQFTDGDLLMSAISRSFEKAGVTQVRWDNGTGFKTEDK
jgi:transposase-like protein